MSDREIYELSTKNIDSLVLNYDYEKDTANPYYIKDLKKLRFALKSLSYIPFLSDEFKKLTSTAMFDDSEDTKFYSANEFSLLNTVIYNIKVGLNYFIKYFELNNKLNDDFSLTIKLPELETFSDLSKVSSDFKKAIEIPLLDSKVESELRILTAEKGSIWLYVALGSSFAVSLIASITWSAALVKRRKAEAKIYEAHTRTLELKNEMIETYVSAQKALVEKVLEDEAELIATKQYSEVTPETIERLKLSISTVSDLIDRGAKILPTSNSEEVKKLFPDFDKLSLIQSAIKKIS